MLKDIHGQIVEKVRNEKPEMEEHLPKNFGFGVSVLLSRPDPGS